VKVSEATVESMKEQEEKAKRREERRERRRKGRELAEGWGVDLRVPKG